MLLRISRFGLLFKGCVACLLLSGCYKNHLYVQQEWVDADFLASSKVHTPDPRQDDPPLGQRLLIAWDFPKSVFEKNLTLVATVRRWDNTQEVLTQPIERKRDTTAFFFSHARPGGEGRILTYRVQVVAASGDVVNTWEHHFWTDLIDIGKKSSD